MTRLLAIVLVFALASGRAGADEALVTVRPVDNGGALVNPGMGWVFHHYDNGIGGYGGRLAPFDTVDDFPGLSTIYLRLAWSYLEPEEGKFNWAIVDTPAQKWIAKGKRIAFRITCAESHDAPFATPRWVMEAGAKGYSFQWENDKKANVQRWSPDYDDPIFLDRLDKFLAALAARYDGDPNVDFMDVGSLGTWGEMHTGYTPNPPIKVETLKKHLDLWAKHFKKTLLVVNDDAPGGWPGVDYARGLGMALRDDSILWQGGERAFNKEHAAWGAKFTLRGVPVIIESDHYGGSKQRGVWDDGEKYFEAMERYGASYASIHYFPREFYAEQKALVDRMNRRLGYRIQLVEATWPKAVPAKGRVTFSAQWRNAGVAPCLPGGQPAFTLKDEQGGIAAVFVDEGFSVRELAVNAPPGAARRNEFALPPFLKPGRYGVFVSIGNRSGTPRLALPLDGDDGIHRYRLGEIEVVAAK